MKGYVVIYEKVECVWQARSPDVPGCIAEGNSLMEVEANFQVVLDAHLEQLRTEGQTLPEPSADLRRFRQPPKRAQD